MSDNMQSDDVKIEAHGTVTNPEDADEKAEEAEEQEDQAG